MQESRFAVCDDASRRNDFTIDEKLIEEARLTGNHETAEDAVTAALQEYIWHRRRHRILDAFGTVDFDPPYDYKAERCRKQMG